MSRWPRNPAIYEIKHMGLALRHQREARVRCRIELCSTGHLKVGLEEVWLMGVLQRSPACIAVSNQNQFLLDDFERALPDFRPEDKVGSVFSVRRYVACAVVPGGPTTRASRIFAARYWEQGEDRAIVAVNLTGALAQGRVHLPWSDLQENAWRLRDCLSDAVDERNSVAMSQQGLYGGPRTLEMPSIPVLPRHHCCGGLVRARVTSPGLMAEPESRK